MRLDTREAIFGAEEGGVLVESLTREAMDTVATWRQK